MTSLTLKVAGCCELNLVRPETLQYLSLSKVGLANHLICSPHLKFLRLLKCRRVSTPELNDELEVLELDSPGINWTELLDKAPESWN